MTKTEYKLLKQLDGFLNELRILLYSKYYKPEVDKLSKSLNQTEVQNQIANILKKPFFEINISKEHKSFRKDYRLRENIGNKLSISLKEYEQEMIKLLAILTDYEKENNNSI